MGATDGRACNLTPSESLVTDSTETPLVPPQWQATLLGAPEPPSEPAPRTAPDDVDRIPLVYIAGPFSGADGWAVAENVHAAEKLAREVARMGAAPLTPHSIGARMAGTETQAFWIAATLKMMRRCDAVLFTADWQRSTGARGEHEEAARRGMPIFYSTGALSLWLDRGKGAA